MLGLSMPFSKTASLVLGILGLIVAYQAITGIHAESIGPNSKKLEGVINEFGGQTVHIGGVPDGVGDNQVRKHKKAANAPDAQFRGLVAFNMLSAANCNTVMAIDSLLRGQATGKLYFFGEYDYKNPGEDEDGDEIETNPFDALANRTNFDPTCHGADTITIVPVHETLQDLNPLTPPHSETGNDMEGKFGRIDFTVQEHFIIGDHGKCDPEGAPMENPKECPELLMGTHIGKIKNEPPEFFNGNRYSAFIPAGLKNQGGWNVKDHELYHDEGGEGGGGGYYRTGWIGGEQNLIAKLYAYRVRMENVPGTLKAMPKHMDFNRDILREDGPGDEGKYETLVEEIEWHFCPGAEGFIQSNAYKLGKEDEADKDNPGSVSKKENMVYPKVVMTNNENSCIQTGSEDFNGFFGHTINKDGELEICSPDNVISGSGKEVEEGSHTFHCGLKKISIPGRRFNGRFKGEIDNLYRAGWFLEDCPKDPITFDKVDDGIKTENGENIEIKEDKTILETPNEKGTSVKWNFSSSANWEDVELEFNHSMDININDKTDIMPRTLDIYVGNDYHTKAVIRLTYHNYDNEDSTDNRVELKIKDCTNDKNGCGSWEKSTKLRPKVHGAVRGAPKKYSLKIEDDKVKIKVKSQKAGWKGPDLTLKSLRFDAITLSSGVDGDDFKGNTVNINKLSAKADIECGY